MTRDDRSTGRDPRERSSTDDPSHRAGRAVTREPGEPSRPRGRRTARTSTRRRDGEERSVPDLLRELSEEGADLIRNEVALARAEMEEKADHFRNAATSMAVGGALLVAALLTLLWAANIGLTALLVQWIAPDIAAWLSPLILGTVLGLIGYGMVRSGRNRMSEEGLTPHMTADSLKEDRQWVRSRTRNTREERT